MEGVSKRFRVRQSRAIKDRLLGVTGHRPRDREVWAVRDLRLDIRRGEALSLLGANGSGKSTMLKLLAGTIAPTHGRIWAHGRIVPLLELGAGFHPDLSGRENVYLNAALLGLSKSETRCRLDAIVSFAEVGEFLDTPVRFYSSGMAVRLGFAIAVNVEPEILLIDEVLAVGDERFQAACIRRMEALHQEGRTIVLVTHSFSQATEFAERAVVLCHGSAIYDGAADEAGSAYRRSVGVDGHEA